MITITRRLEIDAGHRLMNHEGKCKNVHGHRYVFEVECVAPELDSVGRIIDFSVVKAELGGWLDRWWDHGFIYEDGDPIADWLKTHGQKCYAVHYPPTAENLAMAFLKIARGLMEGHAITIASVTVHETPNCRAHAS